MKTKMKKWKINLKNNLALTVAMMAVGTAAHATGQEGHGGAVEVCYTDSTKTTIKSVDLYDLFEHKDNFPIPTDAGTESKDHIMQRVLGKIAESQPGLVREMQVVLAAMSKKGFIYDKKSAELSRVEDVKSIINGINCDYRQMVNWFDPTDKGPNSGDEVYRDQTFYQNSVNALNQAALDIHEAAYKVYRVYLPEEAAKYGSEQVRELVAEAFSDGPIRTTLIPVNPLEEGTMIEDGIFSYLDDSGRTVRIQEDRPCVRRSFNVQVKATSKKARVVDVQDPANKHTKSTKLNFGETKTIQGNLIWVWDGSVNVTISGCGLSQSFDTTSTLNLSVADYYDEPRKVEIVDKKNDYFDSKTGHYVINYEADLEDTFGFDGMGENSSLILPDGKQLGDSHTAFGQHVDGGFLFYTLIIKSLPYTVLLNGTDLHLTYDGFLDGSHQEINLRKMVTNIETPIEIHFIKKQ